MTQFSKEELAVIGAIFGNCSRTDSENIFKIISEKYHENWYADTEMVEPRKIAVNLGIKKFAEIAFSISKISDKILNDEAIKNAPKLITVHKYVYLDKFNQWVVSDYYYHADTVKDELGENAQKIDNSERKVYVNSSFVTGSYVFSSDYVNKNLA